MARTKAFHIAAMLALTTTASMLSGCATGMTVQQYVAWTELAFASKPTVTEWTSCTSRVLAVYPCCASMRR